MVTERVTDTGTTVTPMIHHFGWQPDDFDKITSGGLPVHAAERRPTSSDLELDKVAGGEALGFDADGANAVGAVAADLSSVVHDEDQQVPLLRTA